MDTTILEEIGLTQGEIKTYLALLKTGSSSTGKITKESTVSRSKLYIILDKLAKKGLVSHVEKNGVLHFQAVEPSKIHDYLKKKQKDLEKLNNDFQKFLLPQLELFQKEAEPDVKVAFYAGMKGIQTAHEHTYLKLKKGEYYYYLGILGYQPQKMHLYWQRDHVRRAKEGIKCKLLFNKDVPKEVLENRNSYKGCTARAMPTDIITPAGILVYKDTTTILLQSPNELAIEIVGQRVADSFLAYFNDFWKKTKPFHNS